MVGGGREREEEGKGGMRRGRQRGREGEEGGW